MTGALALDQDQDVRPDLPDIEIATPDEDESYSKRVQARINKEVNRRHAAERERDAALARERELRERLGKAEETGLTYYEQTVSDQLSRAEQEVAEAFEAGDARRHAEAQRKLADAAVRARELETHKARRQAEPAPQPSQTEPQVSSRTQEWIARNSDWWNRDRAMTQAALAFHEDVTRRGIPSESEEYFVAIDQRLRAAFPDRFDDDDPAEAAGSYEVEPAPRPVARRPAASPVAPATRVPAGGTAARPGKVTLTPDQVEIARSMGVDPKAYAKSLITLQKDGRLGL
jgi:hypothetical protein